MTRKEIAELIGLSYSRTTAICQAAGIKPLRPKRELCENTKQIIKLRREGLGYNAIAKALGLAKCNVISACRAAGLRGTVADPHPNRLTEEKAAEYVSKSGFDYVRGYTAGKKPIIVRCRKCGRTFERQFHIFRDVVNGTWMAGNECPLCRQDSQETVRQIQEQQREQRRIEREHEARIKAEQRAKDEADLISRQMEERLAIHVCKNCGQEYSIGVTGYNSEQYCCAKCAKRWAMRIKNDRRLRRLKSRPMDSDITLEKLFARDHGICYLCGEPCDWADVTDGNAGDRYPSIDHVKPVSKGGSHTWNNIKLAHRVCNTAKRDSEPPR